MTPFSLARRVIRQDGGVALIEFALSLPVLMLLYLGGYQLCDALSCKRKVTITTRAGADLTSQFTTVAPSDLTGVMGDSAQIMTPYSASRASIQVSQLYTDSNGNTTVSWSMAQNAQPLATNSVYTLPALIKTNSSYIIVAKVVYAYKPAVSFGLVPNLTFGDTIYMNPRNSNSVTCNGCS